MTVSSVSSKPGSCGPNSTDSDGAERSPVHPQTMLSRNVDETTTGLPWEEKVPHSRAGHKPPKIRWAEEGEEEEFTVMPEVFLRQDAPPRGISRGLSKIFLLGVFGFSGLIVTGAVLFTSSGRALVDSLVVQGRAIMPSTLDWLEELPAPEAPPAGKITGLSEEIPAELQSKARAALTEAINSRQGVTSSVEAAADAGSSSEITAGEPLTTRLPDAPPKPPSTTKSAVVSEHAAAPSLSGSADRTSQRFQFGSTAKKKSPASPLFLAFQGGTYFVPVSREGEAGPENEEIQLGAFEMAYAEVTRREWLACANEQACEKDSFPEGHLDPDKLDLPVTSVTMPQIEAYIGWLNRSLADGAKPFRLPTEAEWIVAARGGARQALTYPWGEHYAPENIDNRHDLAPVTGTTVVNDLAGIISNAEERVSDCWGAALKSGGCYRNLGVVRGAPPGHVNETTARLSYRSRRALTIPYSTVGFRLAR